SAGNMHIPSPSAADLIFSGNQTLTVPSGHTTELTTGSGTVTINSGVTVNAADADDTTRGALLVDASSIGTPVSMGNQGTLQGFNGITFNAKNLTFSGSGTVNSSGGAIN